MLSGAIILDEQSMYKWHELILLSLCSSICVVGIIIIIKKPKSKKEKVNEDKPLQHLEKV